MTTRTRTAIAALLLTAALAASGATAALAGADAERPPERDFPN